MTNPTPPPTQQTITIKEDLQDLVKKAIEKGVLDISNCIIDVEFNLPDLLKRCGQQPEIDTEYGKAVECPFELDVDFATFNNKASFRFVTFSNYASFYSTTFNNEVEFSFATFNDEVNFKNATFNDTCKNKTFFICTTFNDKVDFSSATFNNEINFNNAIFKKNINLQDLNLCSIVSFDIQQITIEASLQLSVINHDNPIVKIIEPIITEQGCIVVDYDKKKAEQHWQLHVHNMECDGDVVRLKIRNLSAKSNAEIQFKDCCFYGKNVAFTNVAMKNVRIEGGNTVKGMLFDHCDFSTTKPTEWQLQHLHFRSLAGEDQWLNSTDPEKLKERALVYASLKTTATEAGETQLANDFHFWQQYYQGKCKFSPWNTMYKYTSAYGLDVGLPFYWFFGVLTMFALLYTLLLNPIDQTMFIYICFYIGFYSLLPTFIDLSIHKPFNKLSILYFIGVGILSLYLVKGLPLSISSSLPFIFADNDTIKALLPSIPKTFSITWASGKVLLFYVLYIFQHLLQGFLLFQIGAAIRNKVKR